MFGLNKIKKKNVSLDEKIEQNTYLGLTVICEDDVLRTVYNVASPSIQNKSQYWKKGLLVINEGDPLEPLGHWVTLLALECALHGDKQPTKEQRHAFIRLAANVTTVNLDAIKNSHQKGKLPMDFSD